MLSCLLEPSIGCKKKKLKSICFIRFKSRLFWGKITFTSSPFCNLQFFIDLGLTHTQSYLISLFIVPFVSKATKKPSFFTEFTNLSVNWRVGSPPVKTKNLLS